jgi:hypothetical protein
MANSDSISLHEDEGFTGGCEETLRSLNDGIPDPERETLSKEHHRRGYAERVRRREIRQRELLTGGNSQPLAPRRRATEHRRSPPRPSANEDLRERLPRHTDRPSAPRHEARIRSIVVRCNQPTEHSSRDHPLEPNHRGRESDARLHRREERDRRRDERRLRKREQMREDLKDIINSSVAEQLEAALAKYHQR